MSSNISGILTTSETQLPLCPLTIIGPIHDIN